MQYEITDHSVSTSGGRSILLPWPVLLFHFTFAERSYYKEILASDLYFHRSQNRHLSHMSIGWIKGIKSIYPSGLHIVQANYFIDMATDY